MIPLLHVRFPDGTWEYHVPKQELAVGDVIRTRNGSWTVLTVGEPKNDVVIAAVARVRAEVSWPGPVENIRIYALRG